MEKEIEERLTAVEMKLAYMEDFVSQIQGVAVNNHPKRPCRSLQRQREKRFCRRPPMG